MYFTDYSNSYYRDPPPCLHDLTDFVGLFFFFLQERINDDLLQYRREVETLRMQIEQLMRSAIMFCMLWHN